MLFTNSRQRENIWTHSFCKSIIAIWNTNSLVQDFESCSPCSFCTTTTIRQRLTLQLSLVNYETNPKLLLSRLFINFNSTKFWIFYWLFLLLLPQVQIHNVNNWLSLNAVYILRATFNTFVLRSNYCSRQSFSKPSRQC